MFKQGLFNNHRILVTGGGSGLGKAMAGRLLELGAEIVICGRRESVLAEAADELTSQYGGTVRTYGVDLRDAAAVERVVQAIWDESGPLTGLINNAAGNFISRTEDLSSRGFDAIANDAKTIGTAKHTLSQLSAVLQKCVACHESYQLRTPAAK